MPRYFIEVNYKGTAYSGFQVQNNAVTIQSEIEKALQIYFKQSFSLTGSSRTDAGVHALQNFFHFDTTQLFSEQHYYKKLGILKDSALKVDKKADGALYNLNAILPKDIVIKKIFQVEERLIAGLMLLPVNINTLFIAIKIHFCKTGLIIYLIT